MVRPGPLGRRHPRQPARPGGFRRSLDLLHEFVETTVESYHLDAARVGLFGFSQGAILALSALVEQPDAYRWIVALNGYLAAAHEDEVDATESKPVFFGCGSMDRILPAERAAERLREAGADVRFEEYRVGHGTTPEELTDVVAWLEDVY